MEYDLANSIDRVKLSTRIKALIKKTETKSTVVVSLTEKQVAKSLAQNAYAHVAIEYFASQTGNTADYVKQYYFKRLCNKDIFAVAKDDPYYGKIYILRSFSSLTKEEMTTAIDRFITWASQEGGIYIPTSEEYINNLALQKEINNDINQNKMYIR